MEFRLRDVRQIVTEELPPEARKPTYIMEFGVRGIRDIPDKPDIPPDYWEDGTQLARTNIAAFQELWFDIESAQLGFTGAVKWDAYSGKYDNGTQAHWLIGSASEGWPLFPALPHDAAASTDDPARLASARRRSLDKRRLGGWGRRPAGEGNRGLGWAKRRADADRPRLARSRPGYGVR
jgi:hypothetical protein